MYPENMKKSLFENLWDVWCCVSIIGIWPRFIEPNMLTTTKIDFPIQNLPKELDGLRILQISDLHLSSQVSQNFLDKLSKKIKKLAPDILVFTGDFICYGKLNDEKRLLQTLNQFEAPYGSFAIFGNHDYDKPVSVSPEGNYDIIDSSGSIIGRGFKALLQDRVITGKVTDRAKAVGFQEDLVELLKSTPLTLLHNENKVIPVKGTFLNVCGLGEYMLDKSVPEEAYKNYDPKYPGLILVHNPDGIKKILGRPGELILSGHTHGGQVNLPWMWKKFTLLEDRSLYKGLYKREGKWIYVNRGVGGVMKFRWFSPPELMLATLKKES